MLEKDQDRVNSMFKRRCDILKPLVDEINPTAFESLWVELAMDYAGLTQTMFDSRYNLLKEKKTMPKDASFTEMNNIGQESI
jgi:hypothetical protein